MSAWADRFAAAAFALLLLAGDGRAADLKYGLGRPATPQEIAGWDIDVRPDGKGLPQGSGSVLDGEAIYLERCAACHGEFGEGVGRYSVLMGGFGTLDQDRPEKTIGSFWPYASTVWDYVYRTMPFGESQSLTADETYAVTAFLLYLNEVVEDDFVLTQENLAAIVMPNAEGFILREGTDIAPQEPCMTDCKESVEVIGRAGNLDVTPDDEPQLPE